MPDVIMLRHCESAGWESNSPLTSRGYEQADGLVGVLQEMSVDYVASSPFLRAYESIAPFAESQNLEIHIDDRLAERTRSDEPLEDWEGWVRQSFMDIDFRAPGGESGREVARRGLIALSEALESDYKLPLLSTHGQLMSFLANSFDPDFDYEHSSAMDYPALMRFSRKNGVITYEAEYLKGTFPATEAL